MQISNLPCNRRVSAPTRPLRSVRLCALVNSARIRPKKQQLLTEISRLNRGVSASIEDRNRVDTLCQALEELNPIPAPLEHSSINGKWELLYTTSDSLLAINRPSILRPNGAIFQTLDVKNLRARNQETWPFFSEVTADLTPVSKSKVKLQFDTFKIFGLIPFKAPPSARGWLDTTYLDEELRISRSGEGNLFVLIMKDKKTKPQ